jgi:hypothetical protein
MYRVGVMSSGEYPSIGYSNGYRPKFISQRSEKLNDTAGKYAKPFQIEFESVNNLREKKTKTRQ